MAQLVVKIYLFNNGCAVLQGSVRSSEGGGGCLVIIIVQSICFYNLFLALIEHDTKEQFQLELV